MNAKLDFSTRQLADPTAGFQQNVHQLGSLFGQFQKNKLEEERYQTELARQKVLDDRATQLWNEQQQEKENLLMAGQLRANPQATKAAILAEDPMFGTAMQQATKAGLDTGMMGVEGVMNWYNSQAPKQGINLTASVPNVGGTVGGAIYKNVAVGGTSQPDATATPVPAQAPAKQTPSAGLGTPQAKAATTQGGTTDYTNIIPKTIMGAGNFRPLDALVAANKKVGEAMVDTIKGAIEPAVRQAKTTKGKGGYQDKVLTEAQLNPQAPLVALDPKTASAVDKTIDPKTPAQKTKSKETVTKTMEKVLVGYTKGTPPKLNQVEASTIDAIFSSVDPNAQSRDSAKQMIEGLYYSLGLKPSQVKEYAEGTVESVYGDKNDPIKLAVANAKLNVLQKNVDATNELGIKMYSENRADARQALQLAHSERIANKSNDAKLAPGYTLWKNPKTGQIEPILQSDLAKAGAAAIEADTPQGRMALQKQKNDMYNQYRTTFKENDTSWLGKAPLSMQQWEKAGMPAL